MARSEERFMRMLVDRWLDDEKIRGTGDDGQREDGIPLELEGVYLRLCLTQFRQPDGHLPNRRAFLCDAVACPSASYERVIVPVLERFFRKSRDGARWYNVRTLSEWQTANSKSQQAKAAADVKWRKLKQSLAPVDASADPDASTDAACESERERESENKSEKEEAAESVTEAPADEDPKGALELLRCPRCNAVDTIVKDRPDRPNAGWWCAPKRGGCTTNFVLGDPRIVEHLSPNVRRSVLAELQERRQGAPPRPEIAECRPDPEAERVKGLVLERLRPMVSPHWFGIWFSPWTGVAWDESRRRLRVRVPDAQWKNQLGVNTPGAEDKRTFGERLRAAAKEAGYGDLTIEFEFDRPEVA